MTPTETKAPLPDSVEAALDRPQYSGYYLLLPKHVETLRAHIEAQARDIERLRGALDQAVRSIEYMCSLSGKAKLTDEGKQWLEGIKSYLAPKQGKETD